MSLELADVFAWFFALYNAVSKDEPWFEKVFWAQFSTCQWCHKLPCTCPDVLGEIEIITNWRLSRATLEALDVAGTAKEV
jgi:hypothetical protein